MTKEAQKIATLVPKLMNAFHDLGRQQHPQKEKLSMRQFQALMILNVNITLTPSQLCKKLKLAASTGTELVNRMITLHYIQKEHEDKDQRQVNLTVAPAGLKILQQRHKDFTNIFTKFLEPFEQQDKEQFVSSFEKIWELIEKYK